MGDAVLHDHRQVVLVLQDRDVLHRIAAHQQQVGEIALLDQASSSPIAISSPPTLVAATALRSGVAEQPDEVLEIARVGARGVQAKP